MTTQAKAPRPLPEPSLDDKAHWEGLKRHEFLIQKCNDCGVLQHPARPMCPACRSLNRGWQKASGRGTLYSYTIIYQATHPWWRDKVPYNVAVVELQEDVRVVSNVVGVPNEKLKVGMPLEMIFEDAAEDITLPMFQPRK